MPGSPRFETPTLAVQVVARPSTRVAMRTLGKAVERLRPTRFRRTRDTFGRLPKEQVGSAQDRSRWTSCTHHIVPSASAGSCLIFLAKPRYASIGAGNRGSADYASPNLKTVPPEQEDGGEAVGGTWPMIPPPPEVKTLENSDTRIIHNPRLSFEGVAVPILVMCGHSLSGSQL
jgi:hypothetical protein